MGGDFDWLREVTSAFVRIGAVLMAVFIINILVSFARYNAKVANSLETRADCLMLAAGEMDRLAALLAVMSLDVIDFTKVPTNPYDRYLDTIKSLLPAKPDISQDRRPKEPE